MAGNVNVYRAGKGRGRADRALRRLCIECAAARGAGRMFAAGAGDERGAVCEECGARGVYRAAQEGDAFRAGDLVAYRRSPISECVGRFLGYYAQTVDTDGDCCVLWQRMEGEELAAGVESAEASECLRLVGKHTE